MILNKCKLEIAMAKKCVNAYDVCKTANMQYQMFHRIFNGANCKPATVGRIAAALGVDVTEIIDMEGA